MYDVHARVSVANAIDKKKQFLSKTIQILFFI